MRRAWLSAVLICALATAARAEFQCGYVLVSETIENWDGQPVDCQVWEWQCWDSITVTGSDPGSGGDGTTTPPPPPEGPPPPPPSIAIDSISDESPYAPKLNVSYNETVAQVWLFRDGVRIGTFVPPATTFDLPSLDNMIAPSTWLQVEATNGDRTIVVTADAHVNRRAATVQATNDFLLQWFQDSPGGGDYVISHYYNALGTEIYYADYDVPTTGARNGRVQHVQAEHALYWDNANQPPDTSPSPYPVTFESNYEMVPYAQSSPFRLSRCDVTGLTASMYSWIGWNSRIANCDQMTAYAEDGSCNGSAVITDLNATTRWPPPPAFIIGDSPLTVQP